MNNVKLSKHILDKIKKKIYLEFAFMKMQPILSDLKLAAKKGHHQRTFFDLGGGLKIGGKKIVIMAGPCAVENEKQLEKIVSVMKKAGVAILRGGAYKLRTSPYSFEGLGRDGLLLMSKIAKKHRLKIVTEIIDVRDLDFVYQHTDIFQIGARNMQNFNLLKEIGKTDKPVLLKRAMSATVSELLFAAEHIISHGNKRVILCERGIRTFEPEIRNTLALGTVPLVHELSHLPIVVDPSHATGKASLVPAMAKAAIAAGADGLLIDVHPNPKEALCDGEQALYPAEFLKLLKELKILAKALGRQI
jgi:3-deoxy-7-phosphoheptulonate synthase